jgi:hypothetical protein
MIRLARTATAAVAILAVGAACSLDDDSTERPRTPQAQTAVLALLADRTLVEISSTSGRIVRRRVLGPGTPFADLGSYLALSDDSRRLFVLTPRSPGSGQELAILDPAGLRPTESFPLDRGIVFRAVAVGPRTGRLYLFGNRRAGGGAEDAVVAVLDPSSGETQTSTVREAEGHDWWIIDGAVARDESRLYLSYHGGCDVIDRLCTNGADWIDINGDRLARCGRRTASGVGCLARVHGGVEALEDGLLAATGTPKLIRISDQGKVIADLPSRLAGNHVMEFAVDRAVERAYALGQCLYTGGVSVLDLRSERTRLLSPNVCGERIAVGGDLVAVADQYGSNPLGAPARIALVDARTGSVRYAKVPIETVDLLVAPEG